MGESFRFTSQMTPGFVTDIQPIALQEVLARRIEAAERELAERGLRLDGPMRLEFTVYGRAVPVDPGVES